MGNYRAGRRRGRAGRQRARPGRRPARGRCGSFPGPCRGGDGSRSRPTSTTRSTGRAAVGAETAADGCVEQVLLAEGACIDLLAWQAGEPTGVIYAGLDEIVDPVRPELAGL